MSDMNTQLLDQLADNIENKAWLEANNQELYDICRALLRHNDQIERVIHVLLQIIPQTLYFEDVKRWGKLLERAYLYTLFAQSNGIDGLYNTDSIYIFQKRAKIPQLPTKTKRNKRIIIHPTEMLEIYWVLFLGYTDLQKVSPNQLRRILNFSNKVGDVYLNNKTHSTFAFIHLQRGEWEKAITHAEISMLYWRTKRLMLEDGLNNYLLAMAFYHQGNYATASHYMEYASSALLNTTYKLGYFISEIMAIALRLKVGDELSALTERFDLILTMLSRQADEKQIKQVLNYVKSHISENDSDLVNFNERLVNFAVAQH
jgi:hypothetical protein